MAAPRHVFETYIRATPEAIWAAITDPTFTRGTSTARRSRARSSPARPCATCCPTATTP